MSKHGRLTGTTGLLLLAGMLATAGEEPARGTAPTQAAPATVDEADAQAARYERLSLEELLALRIVTASQQDESLREAPVPVTVITSDMIKAIGARNLRDVLVTYVPGMTFVTDHNEMNVAMRGVYASSQQTILVLLDGHRLNSRAYSMANPDYSIRIDLERVKQIEVLRGPGSSLYGNVALTAVINVVTRPGSELDGLTVSAAGGGYVSGQDDADGGALDAGRSLGFTYGKGFAGDRDLVLWGGLFRAEGQKLPVAREDDFAAAPREGYTFVDGIKDPGSYDAGLRYRSGSVTVLANTRYGKMVEPFSAGGATGAVYEYDQYRRYEGVGPGLGSRSNHLDVRYDASLRSRTSLALSAYYDTNRVEGTLVTDPALRRGTFIGWNDDALGGIGQVQWSYGSGRREGTLLLGAQVDHMRLRNSTMAIADNGEWTRFGDTSRNPLLQPGSETIYSGFTQLKQRLGDRFIVNSGFRVDVKDRHRGPNVSDFSPRLGLIWMPDERLDVKVSYAQSFVDAPYWYRYNSFPSYQGSQDLRPEHLRSWQFTPTLSLRGGRLRNTLNVFYNDVADFIFRDLKAGPNDPKYRNAGSLHSLGIEHELALVEDRYRLRGMLTFQHELSARDFDARDGEIFNVPRVTAGAVADVNAFSRGARSVWLSLTVRYVGGQLAPIAPTSRLQDGVVKPFADPDHRLDGYALANLGVRLLGLLQDRAQLEASVYNLFDQEYSQGGSVLHPYPQAGRSFVVNLSYRWAESASGQP